MSEVSRTSRVTRHLLSWMVSGTIHILGIAIISIVFAIPYLDFQLVGWYKAGFEHADTARATLIDIGLHIGLATCLWAMLVILFKFANERRRSLKRSIKVARGTIMTETLIILVPFLLLTSGLAQLTILNIAGILGNLAAYQSARVAWVWQPEADAGRRGVGGGTVAEKARIAAAATYAPAAPSSYAVSGGSPDLNRLRGTMFAYFGPSKANNMGGAGIGQSSAALGGGTGADHIDLYYNYGWDVDSFPDRAARKLTMAYEATSVQIISGGNVGARVVYQQNMVFPWFAYIWGTQQTIGGRNGWYTPITRTCTFPAQVGL